MLAGESLFISHAWFGKFRRETIRWHGWLSLLLVSRLRPDRLPTS